MLARLPDCLRRDAPNPIKPAPKSIMVAGSGARDHLAYTDWVARLKSKLAFVSYWPVVSNEAGELLNATAPNDMTPSPMTGVKI